MTSIYKDCMCISALGATSCDNEIGIDELYWIHPSAIIGHTFNSVNDTCCPEGEIATLELMQDGATFVPTELFQPIHFTEQDDLTGAIFSSAGSFEGGNKSRLETMTFQVPGADAETDCVVGSILGNAPVFLIKLKAGPWQIVNMFGGLRGRSDDKNTNQTYTEVVVNGTPNLRALYIDPVWASTNLVANTASNPGGLLAA